MGALSLLESVSACPSCRAPLVLREGAFACTGCGVTWPIVGGIPRFVASEHYARSFGYQWRRHRTTQLDSQHRSRESEETFHAKTGLGPDDVRGKLVLEVGVGTGRFAEVVARWGGRVFGIDLSLAVLSARRNLPPSAVVAQADLFKLPFREETFDVVYSIGVLHHTPSTREAFGSIARFVKPGGVLAVAVYKHAPDSYHFAERYRRYTTAMSSSLLHLLSHVAIARHHVLEAAKLLGSPAVEHQVRRALPTSEHGDPLWRVLDTFDWYSPRYQWKHEDAEVRRWYEALGFVDVRQLPEWSMASFRGTRSPGPLRAPLRTDEQRSGELLPLPAWVPPEGTARDLVLLAALASEVAVAGASAAGTAALQLGRGAVTAAVVTAKRAIGAKPR